MSWSAPIARLSSAKPKKSKPRFVRVVASGTNASTPISASTPTGRLM